MSEEPRVGVCMWCYLEFDLDGEGVTISSASKSGKALIEFERRAHNLLMGKDRDSLSVQKRIAAENNCSSRMQIEESEEVIEATESLDDFTGNLLGDAK